MELNLGIWDCQSFFHFKLRCWSTAVGQEGNNVKNKVRVSPDASGMG
jgi:hypothetical protein